MSDKENRIVRELHKDLAIVVVKAREIIPFRVLEGVRSRERQQELLLEGASRTLNSRHLTGHAVDLGALVSGQLRWDWPLYAKIAAVMKGVAYETGVPVEWGGDWKSFKDGPHFELSWKKYK